MKPRVLITGGPTRAYLDSIRFLSNYSTGELAYQMAQDFTNADFEVSLVLGKTNLNFNKLRLKRVFPIITNDEMLNSVIKVCSNFNPSVAIFSAAVLDFIPKKTRQGKLSSKQNSWKVELVPAPKIIDVVGKLFPKIRRVGFKLEWEVKTGKQLERFARGYMDKKGLSALVVNFFSQISGKHHPAHVFTYSGKVFRTKSKKETSQVLVKLVTENRY